MTLRVTLHGTRGGSADGQGVHGVGSRAECVRTVAHEVGQSLLEVPADEPDADEPVPELLDADESVDDLVAFEAPEDDPPDDPDPAESVL